MKRVIAWSLVTVILIATLSFAFWNINVWNFNIDFGSINYKYPDDDKYNTGNATITREELNGINTLDIDWVDGSIDIISYDGDIVELYESSDKALDDDTVMRWRIHDGKIRIKYYKSGWIFGLFGKSSSNLKKKLTVKIPVDMISEIKVEAVSTNVNLDLQYNISEADIETVSGDIRLNGIHTKNTADDEIDIKTTSGKIELYDSSSSKLKCESTSGSITVNGIFDNEAKVSAVSGKLELSGIFKNLKCSTVSGDINIRYDGEDLESYKECLSSLGKCSIETVSGTARLICAEFPCGFVADMDTVSGSFSSDFATSSANNEYRYGRGEFEIDFESVSGNFKINKN